MILLLIFLPIASASFFIGDNNYGDDFEDTLFNTTFWQNGTIETGGDAALMQQITAGDGHILMRSVSTDDGVQSSAETFMNNTININGFGDMTANFTWNSSISDTGACGNTDGTIRISVLDDGSETNMYQESFTCAGAHSLPSQDWSVTLDDSTGNITLYNQSVAFFSTILSGTDWRLRFYTRSRETSAGGGTGGVQTAEINVFDFTMASDNPVVNLSFPGNGTTTIEPILNATITKGIGTLDNATLNVWNSTGDLINESTNTITGDTNDTSFNIGTPPTVGDFTWNVLACDTNNNCQYATNNHSFTYGFILNSEDFEATVGDLTPTNFSINITVASEIISTSANFEYNGTTYTPVQTTQGADIIFDFTLDTPSVDASTVFDFNWNIFLTSSTQTTEFNTDTQQQTVTPSNFSQCTASFSVEAVNYTIFDESNPTTPVDATMFLTLFEWNLGGTLTKNITFSDNGSASYTFCIEPNVTFFVDAQINVEAPGFSSRSFFLRQAEYNNISTLQSLYILNESLASVIIIEIVDEGIAPLENYKVEIFREVTGVGELLVESDITDSDGQVVTKLIENDAKYKILIYDENDLLKKTITGQVIACKTTPCLQTFVIQDTVDDFSQFDSIENHVFSLTFDNVTNTFVYSWNDNTGDAGVSHRLIVTRDGLNGSTIVCNETSSTLVSSINCAVGSTKASYTAQAYRTTTASGETRIFVIATKVGSIASTFGAEGLIWAFFLLSTLFAIGLFSPVVAITLYTAGLIFLGVTDIIYMSPFIFWGQIAIAIAFIWSFKS